MNKSNRTPLTDALLPRVRPMALEQRFMFDAAAASTATDPQHTLDTQHTDASAADSLAKFAIAATVSVPVEVRALDPALNNGRKEVAFIDKGVADYQTLVDGVRAGVEVVLLDAGQDGLAQMALWAQSHSGYDAIHVLSHGSDASIQLGQFQLSNANLNTSQVQSELMILGQSLTINGDLLIYGCDVAQDSNGQAFVSALAAIIAKDVAASIDPTGKYGNWNLEYQKGPINTLELDVSAYSYELASGTITFNSAPGTKIATDGLGGSADISGITIQVTSSLDQNWTYESPYGVSSGLTVGYANSDPQPLITIKSSSTATNFWFKGILMIDSGGVDVKIEGFDNGVSTGYVNLTLSTNGYENTFTTTQLTQSKFQNVDEIRITPQSGSGMFVTINNIVIGDPVGDTTPPVAPSAPDMSSLSDSGASNSDNITNVTIPIFTGTAEANSTVRLYDTDGSTLLGTATADGSGNWSITSSTLSQGSHNLTAKATDAAGNTSAASSSLSVTVDTTAPTLTVASAAFAADTGTSSTDFITKTAAQTVSGTLSANLSSGETVYVSLDNGSTWTAATATTGQSTWSLAGQTLTASNTLKVRVSDAAGNNGTAYSQAYVLDTTAPATTVATKSFSADTGSSSTDFITKTAVQTVSGTLSANVAAGEVVYVSLDNGSTWSAATTTVGANTWSLSGQTLTGSNTLKVKVTDTAGNDGTVSSQAYVLDTTAPAGPSTPDMTSGTDSGTSNSDNITSNTTPVFSGTATANSVVTLYDTDGATVLGTTTSDGSGNWSITSSTLSSGSHTITAKVTDTAGNESVASAGLSVTVDTAAPSAIALSSNTLSNSASANTAVGTLSSTDATVGDTCTYALVAGAGSTDNASFSISGSSLQANNPSALSAGSYSVRVRTTDAAGNSFEQTFSITVTSNQAPAVTTPTAIALTDTSNTDTFSNQTGTLSATDADGIASYDIQGGTTGGSTVVGAATYDVSKLGTYGTLYVKSSDGSYVYVPNASAINGRLANTSETFTVTATDSNVSAATGTATLTVNITGVNDTPTDIGLTATSVSQSGGANATVGTLSTTDADTGDTHTYTLVSGAGDTNNAVFNISGTSLRATNAGSMTPGTYTVRVQTTDAASATYAEAMTITVVDDVAPTVASVAVPTNAWYVAGQNLDFTVNFSESVTVDTTGGTPRVALTVGTTTVYATYLSGSGTSALVFRYTVQANDLDTNGIAVGTLALNGGTLADATGNNAVLTLNSVGSTSAVLVDAATPSAPSTPDLALASDSGTSGTDNITSSTTPTLTGTAEAGSTVTLYDTDGTVLGTTTATGGNWSMTSSTLSSGSHTITAKVTDAAGNVSSASAGLAITIDAVAPTAVALSTTSLADTVATSGSTLATLSATDTSGLTYSLVAGSGDTNNGRFTITGTDLKAGGSNLAAGTYDIRVRATDAAGNYTDQTFTVTVTAGPSVASINRTGASALTNASSVDYTVTYNESVTGVDVSDFVLTTTGTAGGTIASISGSGTTYTVTVNTLSGDGTLRLDLNNSGTGIVNAGTQAITGGFTSGQTYTLDTTAPTAPSGLDMTAGSDSGSSSTDNITSVTTPIITGGGAEAGATVKLYDTDGTTLLGTTTADGSGNWSITTSALTDGAHTLKAKVTDAAGNTGAASTGLTVTIDTTAPSAPSAPDLTSASDSGSSSTDNITSVTTPTLTGSGVEAGATVKLYDTDGTTLLGTATADGSGNWSITSSTLASGAHTLTTKVTDAAGNTSAASAGLTVTIDTTAPSAPGSPDLASGSDTGASNTDNLTNTTTPTITGSSAEPGAIIKLYDTDGTTVLGTATADGSGNWSITSSTLSAGAHTLTTKATDAAGNTSAASAGLTVTIDTSVPIAAVAPDLSSASDAGTSNTDNLTNATTPTITGSGAEAGAIIKLYDTDGTTLLGTATADGSGNWSITSSTLGEGAHGLTYKVTDAAGNTSAPSPVLSMTIDATAPTAPSAPDLANASDLGSSNTDNITSLTTPTITGSGAEAGATIKLYDTDSTTVLGTTTADGSGNWSITTSTLSAGAHTLTTKATDAAGNASAASAALTVTIDTSAPAAPSAPDLASASDSGSSSTDNITNATTPTITGSGAEAGATVKLYDTDGTTLLGTATADGSGNWSITSSTLSDGAHTLTTKATDSAGNTSAASAALTVTIDTSAPAALSAADLTAGSDSGLSNADNITNLTTPTITGSGVEAGANVKLYDTDGTTVLGTATADGSGNWSITPSTLSAGSHTLTTKVTDAAGNTGAASASLTVTIDTSAPAVPNAADLASGSDTGSSNSDNLTNATTPTITGSGAEAGATIKLYDTDSTTVLGTTTADGSGNWSITTSTLSAGAHTLTTKATDAAGNASAASAALTVTIDTSAPAAPSAADLASASDSGSSSADNITSVTTPTVTGGGAEAGATVKLYDTDGTTLLGTATADGSGNWSITSSTLTNGAHTLTTKVTDASGNTSAASAGLTVTIDTTAPSASNAPDLASGSDTGASNTDNLTNATTPTITGSGAESGATVKLYDTDGTTVLGTATADGSGNWSITSSTLSAGSHTLTTKVTDAAGNTGAASAGLTLTVDTTAPTAIALSANNVMDVATGTNTAVATLSSTDAQSVSYTLATGNGTNDAGNASFVIVDGVLQSRSQLTGGTYNIRVGATDAAGNISYETFTITVVGLPPTSVSPPSIVKGPSISVPLVSIEAVRPPVSTFISSGAVNSISALTSDVTALNAPAALVQEAPAPIPSAVVTLGTSSGTSASGLRAMEASRDVVMERGEQVSFTLPAGTFVHSDGAARVSLSARLADGRPLPNYVKFDPTTGTFIVEANPGEKEQQLQVVVNAVDDKGQTASTTLVIKLKEKARNTSAVDLPIKLGKLALAEQFRMADKPAGTLAELAALSKAFAASTAEHSRA